MYDPYSLTDKVGFEFPINRIIQLCNSNSYQGLNFIIVVFLKFLQMRLHFMYLIFQISQFVMELVLALQLIICSLLQSLFQIINDLLLLGDQVLLLYYLSLLIIQIQIGSKILWTVCYLFYYSYFKSGSDFFGD